MAGEKKKSMIKARRFLRASGSRGKKGLVVNLRRGGVSRRRGGGVSFGWEVGRTASLIQKRKDCLPGGALGLYGRI